MNILLLTLEAASEKPDYITTLNSFERNPIHLGTLVSQSDFAREKNP